MGHRRRNGMPELGRPGRPGPRVADPSPARGPTARRSLRFELQIHRSRHQGVLIAASLAIGLALIATGWGPGAPGATAFGRVSETGTGSGRAATHPLGASESPSANGSCAQTAPTASLNCTGLPLAQGATLVAVVYDYLSQDPNVTGSSFTSGSVAWFKNISIASTSPWTNGSPSLFAFRASVGSTDPAGWFDVAIGTSGDILVDWWEFPSAVAPVPRLLAAGDQGSGTGLHAALSGSGPAILVATFASTRPTGAVTTAGSWNFTGGPANPPGGGSGLNGPASWKWVDGNFSLPSPTWTTQYNVTWTALAFTIASAAPKGNAPAPPTGLVATGATRDSVGLAWTNPAGPLVDETVWYAPGACPLAAPASDPIPVSTATTVGGLDASAIYCFAVQASNANGSSPLSSPVTAATPPVYGYDETIYPLPGFDPLLGYFQQGTVDSQVPTLASGPGAPLGVYYVTNSSELVELSFANRTVRPIAAVEPLYQLFGYGGPLSGMLDNEFFADPPYHHALFFGTTTPHGTTYAIELVNLTSGDVQLHSTGAPIDPTNQQPIYIGNDTVIVISSNCSITAYDLATGSSWPAGDLGGNFGSPGACFEANNVYWIAPRQELINVEAAGSSGDLVEQLDATPMSTGQIRFNSVATFAVDSGVVFNWVDGIAYNASSGQVAFSAGYWPASTVFTYVLRYDGSGALSAAGEIRYSADNGGRPTGRLLEIQRYTTTSGYMLGASSGPATWTNGTQLLFDPWNGSVATTNRSFNAGLCGNSCFEGQDPADPNYLIDFSATLLRGDPMYAVVYAVRGSLPPPPLTQSLRFNATGLPTATEFSVSISGSGQFSGYTSANSSSGSVVFDVPGGLTGVFTVRPPPGFTPAPASGLIRLPSTGAAEDITIVFSPNGTALYPVYFNESGLPSGTNWSVSLDGQGRYSTGMSISFGAPTGAHQFVVGPVTGGSVHYRPSPATGVVAVSDAPKSVTVSFGADYPVTFLETGLPSGTVWTVILEGTSLDATGSAVIFFEPNGTYPFTIGAAGGETPSPASGEVNVTDGATSQPVQFGGGTGPGAGFLGLPGDDGYLLILAVAVVAAGLIGAVYWRRRRVAPAPAA